MIRSKSRVTECSFCRRLVVTLDPSFSAIEWESAPGLADASALLRPYLPLDMMSMPDPSLLALPAAEDFVPPYLGLNEGQEWKAHNCHSFAGLVRAIDEAHYCGKQL